MPRHKVIPIGKMKVREIPCECCGDTVSVVNPDVISVICSLCVCKRVKVPVSNTQVKKQPTPKLPKPKSEKKNKANPTKSKSPARKGKRGRKPGVGKVIADYINKVGEADFDTLCKVYAKEMKRQGKDKSEKQIKNNLNALLYVLAKDGKIDYC
jgi:hypothetical protein